MTGEDHLIEGIDVALEVWRFGGLMLFWDVALQSRQTPWMNCLAFVHY